MGNTKHKTQNTKHKKAVEVPKRKVRTAMFKHMSSLDEDQFTSGDRRAPANSARNPAKGYQLTREQNIQFMREHYLFLLRGSRIARDLALTHWKIIKFNLKLISETTDGLNPVNPSEIQDELDERTVKSSDEQLDDLEKLTHFVP